MSDEPQQLLGPLSQSILRDFWKDRAGNWSMENIQKFIVGMSKPPWWRFLARWKWRKAAGLVPFAVPAILLGFLVFNFVSTAASDPAVRAFVADGIDWSVFERVRNK